MHNRQPYSIAIYIALIFNCSGCEINIYSCSKMLMLMLRSLKLTKYSLCHAYDYACANSVIYITCTMALIQGWGWYVFECALFQGSCIDTGQLSTLFFFCFFSGLISYPCSVNIHWIIMSCIVVVGHRNHLRQPKWTYIIFLEACPQTPLHR